MHLLLYYVAYWDPNHNLLWRKQAPCAITGMVQMWYNYIYTINCTASISCARNSCAVASLIFGSNCMNMQQNVVYSYCLVLYNTRMLGSVHLYSVHLFVLTQLTKSYQQKLTSQSLQLMYISMSCSPMLDDVLGLLKHIRSSMSSAVGVDRVFVNHRSFSLL